MRNERKYFTLSVLSVLLVGLLFVTCAREYWRMAAASDRQAQEYALLGAKVYGEYCIQCHGPVGEGNVGIPLDRPDLQGDPRDTRFKETYRMIYETIERGRVGRTTPQWVKADDGRWISYTQMPAWGRDYGGPLDEHYVQAAAYFVAMGNMPQDPSEPDGSNIWRAVEAPSPNMDPELPDAQGLSAEENAAAKVLIEKEILPSCLACHTIGSKGGVIGPNLTNVGSWGDRNPEEWEDFLRRWVYDAPSVPLTERVPSYWHAHRAGRVEPELKDPVDTDLVTTMPSFKTQFDQMGQEKLDLLIKYLMGLK